MYTASISRSLSNCRQSPYQRLTPNSLAKVSTSSARARLTATSSQLDSATSAGATRRRAMSPQPMSPQCARSITRAPTRTTQAEPLRVDSSRSRRHLFDQPTAEVLRGLVVVKLRRQFPPVHVFVIEPRVADGEHSPPTKLSDRHDHI